MVIDILTQKYGKKEEEEGEKKEECTEYCV